MGCLFVLNYANSSHSRQFEGILVLKVNKLEYILLEVFNLTFMEVYGNFHHKILNHSYYPVVTFISHHDSNQSPPQNNSSHFTGLQMLSIL